MTQPLAPIALFVFRRPEHTRRTLEALIGNPGANLSDLYVFCDGARNEQEATLVSEVRDIVRQAIGFASVTVIESTENKGLARSIIDGVTHVLNRHARVIVVEDDLVTTPHFLKFINDGLELYASDEQVASIHGYVYPTDEELPQTFFMKGADCWGWGTWARAWVHFNSDAAYLLNELEQRNLSSAFDMDDTFYFKSMLRDCLEKRNDSWAIRWHASTYLKDMLTLYPARSFVENIGFDASGTHCGTSNEMGGPLQWDPVAMTRIPLVEDCLAREAFKSYFRKITAPKPQPTTAAPPHQQPPRRSTPVRRLLNFVLRRGASA